MTAPRTTPTSVPGAGRPSQWRTWVDRSASLSARLGTLNVLLALLFVGLRDWSNAGFMGVAALLHVWSWRLNRRAAELEAVHQRALVVELRGRVP